MLEKRRQPAHADVAIFVDCGADHRAAMLAKPRRIIAAAAKQRDAKWGAADDHAGRCSVSTTRRWGNHRLQFPVRPLLGRLKISSILRLSETYQYSTGLPL